MKQLLSLIWTPITCVLNGGEDYELLLTLSKRTMKSLKNMRISTLLGIRKVNQGNWLVTKSNNQVALKAQGWDHLNGQEED